MKRKRNIDKPNYCGVIASINPKFYNGEPWLEDVVKGKETRYSSKRANELAYEGRKLLLYSTEDKAIVGEATICSFNNERNNYWYDFKDATTNRSSFVGYTNKVGLKELKKIGINIQILVNLTNAMYEQIRLLSESPEIS